MPPSRLCSFILDSNSSARLRLTWCIPALSVDAGLWRRYVSTEVDARLSFDKDATVAKAHKIIGLYEDLVSFLYFVHSEVI